MHDDTGRLLGPAEIDAAGGDGDASPLHAAARLAAWICGTPMGAISLVGEQEQIFVGPLGWSVDRIDVGSSFCAVAMQTPTDTMVVPDTRVDPRFAGNRLVVGDPYVRSYVGVPLLSAQGVPVGAVCALGDRPQQISAGQLEAMRTLGEVAGQLLQARRTGGDLAAAQRAEHASRQQLQTVFELASTGLCLVDDRGVYVRVNAAFAELLGHPVEDLVGRPFTDVVDADPATRPQVVDDLIAGLRRTAVWEVRYRHRDGSTVPALVTGSLIRPDDDDRWLMFNQVESVVERRAAESELMELQTATDGIVSIDESGVVVAWNRGAERLLGHPAAAMLGRSLDRIIPTGMRAAHHAGVTRAAAGGEPRLIGSTIEVDVVHADGHEVPTELSLSAWTQDGRPRYTAILRDITERREADLHATLVRHAAGTANDADSFREAAERVLTEVCGRLGWRSGHAWTGAGEQVWHLAPHPHPDGRPCPLAAFAAGSPPPDLHGETRITASAGDVPYVDAPLDDCGVGVAVTVPVLAGGEVTGMLDFLLSAGDRAPGPRLIATLQQIGLALGRVMERERTAAVLMRQATLDPVTDLVNRRRLLEHISAAQAELTAGGDTGRLSAVLLINLDRFRLINDSLGYAVGDELLREAARRIRLCVPAADVVARLGADEFVVLTHRPVVGDATDAEATLTDLARDLLHRLRGTVDMVGHRVSLRASIGVCAVTAGAAHFPAGVLRDADAALREAKRRGKDQIQVYDAALRSTAAERIDAETALGAAIGTGQLVLHYQPIIDLDTGVPAGVEALVRWARPGHGLVAPDRFIPLAEESGLIVDLGRWVLQRACRDAAGWPDGAAPLGGGTVSVNVSTRQLIHPRFLYDVDAALGDNGLPAERLILEITESALIEDPDAVMSTLHAVRARGVQLALDDFGTGYSSLSYVQNLPVTILKIDKSFVDPIVGPGRGTILSEVVLKLAEATGLRTVAEGVETREQADALRQLGCHRGQGYTWLRPVALDRLHAAVAQICAGAAA